LSVATSAMKSAALNTIIRKLFHAMALTMFIPVLFWKVHALLRQTPLPFHLSE
jgi:hypothetical protein